MEVQLSMRIFLQCILTENVMRDRIKSIYCIFIIMFQDCNCYFFPCAFGIVSHTFCDPLPQVAVYSLLSVTSALPLLRVSCNFLRLMIAFAELITEINCLPKPTICMILFYLCIFYWIVDI